MDCDADGKQELLSEKRDCKLRGTEQNLSVLRESERRYRELVESINSIIMRWTPDGIVTFVNEFGLKFFGYEKHEMVGRQPLAVPFEVRVDVEGAVRRHVEGAVAREDVVALGEAPATRMGWPFNQAPLPRSALKHSSREGS